MSETDELFDTHTGLLPDEQSNGIEKIRAVVVYDGRSGRVVHTHHAVTFTGATAISDADLMTRALELARECLRNAAVSLGEGRIDAGRKIAVSANKLEAMQVDPTLLASGARYRFDRKSGELQPVTKQRAARNAARMPRKSPVRSRLPKSRSRR